MHSCFSRSLFLFALVKFLQFSQLRELLPSLGELRTTAGTKPPYDKEQHGPKELGGSWLSMRFCLALKIRHCERLAGNLPRLEAKGKHSGQWLCPWGSAGMLLGWLMKPCPGGVPALHPQVSGLTSVLQGKTGAVLLL